ncbi:MAG: ABC transporter substrate-binding protein [Deinococcota bacterium]
MLVSWGFTQANKVYPQQYATPENYMAAGGEAITSFQQSPMLDAQVAAGELPSVAERLPSEPAVVDPLNGIGVYGGELAGPTTVPSCCGWDAIQARMQKLFNIDTDLRGIVPNVARGVDISEDQTSFTIYLREGHKWSDGTEFTAEDFRFFYEDVLLNPQLSPVPNGPWIQNNEPAQFEIIDDKTIRYTFAEPSPAFIVSITEEFGNRGYRPAHYFKQFHIDYNEDANALAEELGFTDWQELFESRMQPYNFTWNLGAETDPGSPTLNSFVFDREDSFGNKYYVRNPYFFKVDTAGNQLPYTDSLQRVLVQDLEVQDFKAISGEYSHFGWGSLLNVPTYRDNEAAGEYRTIFVRYDRGNEYTFVFNFTHEDPVLREIFQDIRFRQAMSLAINRTEINDLIYFGLATPSQAAPTPTSAYYQDWMTDYFADYDVDEANRLLDDMGLTRGSDGFRLRPDGEELFINLQVSVPEEAWQKIGELVADYWNAVGVKTNYKLIENGLYQELRESNQTDVSAWGLDLTDVGEISNGLGRLRPSWDPNDVGLAWNEWLMTDGATGEAPPVDIQELWELGETYLQADYNSQEQLEIGQEFYTQTFRNLYQIGTVQLPPQPLLFKTNLCNTPPEDTQGLWSWTYRQWIMFMPEQWYFSGDGSCQ